MHGAQSRRRGSIGADEVIIGRLRRESSIATNRRVLTGEIAEASRRSLEARSRSREVSVSTRGLDNLRGVGVGVWRWLLWLVGGFFLV